MFTVVSEQDGSPLGVIKRGHPRRGDTVWVGSQSFTVTGRDRDVLTARPAHTPPHASFYENSPSLVVRRAGYNPARRTPRHPGGEGFEEDIPKFRTGMAWSPGQYGGMYGPPSQFPGPYYAPPPTAEGWPGYRPSVWTAYHHRLMIPIFKIEGAYPPPQGSIQRFEGEDFEIIKVLENALLVSPVRPWVLFLVAVDKRTGLGIRFTPLHSTEERFSVRRRLNHSMRALGIPRKDYRLISMKPGTVKKFYKNPKLR